MSVAVVLAGSFRLEQAAAPRTPIVVGSRKERRLIAVLAAHADQAVPADRLVDVLWGDRPPRRPAENLATLVSRLRAQLGPGVVVGDRGVYSLGDPPAVRVDLDTAGQLVATALQRWAQGAPSLCGTAAARALELLGDGSVLLDEADAPWVDDVRARSRRLVRSARHAAAAASLRTGDLVAARDWAAAAVEADHFDETACRLLMCAHQAAGDPALALAAHQRLRVELADELGVDPAAATYEVHLAVLRGEPAPLPEPVAPTPAVVRASPLSGRQRELAPLVDAWAAASSGRPGLVLVVGEAGIGKTRLAAELASTAASTGGLVLSTRCYAAERSLFLQPFVEALTGPLSSLPPGRLRELAGADSAGLAGLVPVTAEALGVDPTARLSPEVELRGAYEAVLTVLRGLAVSRPVLLVLDDLHNAGSATIGLVHYLVRRAGTARLLVVGTLRSEEGSEATALLGQTATRVELGPLDAEAVGLLAGESGQGDRTQAIMARTGGHPLFVVETLRALAAGEAGIPESLRAAVLARLARAGPDIDELLRAGAVLGAAVDPVTLANLLDLTPLEATRRCERAAAARLLVAVGHSYEFVNDLVQEVLYATTPTPVLQVYHRRAADVLVHAPEAVAVHASAIGDWARAARAYLLAGETAAGRGAVGDAEVLLGQALAAAEQTGELSLVGRIRVARARAREALEAYPGALDDLRLAVAAARRCGDRRLEMVALRELGGDAPVAFGVPVADCVASLHAGLRLAASLGDRAAEADLHGRLAVLASHRLSFTEALRHGRRAAQAGRDAGDDRALAVGLDGLKTALAYLGEVDGLTEVVAELEPLARRQGDLFRLHWAVFESAFPAMAAAHWGPARSRITEAIEMSRRSGYASHESWLVAHLGWVARLQGDDDEAVGLGRHALDLSGRTAHRWWRPTAAALLATTLLETGAPEEAVGILTDAIGQGGVDGNEAHRLRCLAALAEASGSREQLDEAAALLSRIVAPPGAAWLMGTDAYLSVARSWLVHGEPGRARAVLAPLLLAARRHRWVPTLAGAALVEGDAAAALGEDTAAAEAWNRALELAGGHAMRGVERAARARLAAPPTT